MNVRAVLMFVVTVGLAAVVGAEQETPVFRHSGKSLFQLCAGSTEVVDLAKCDGYIAGVADALTLFRAFLVDSDQLGIMELPSDLETRAVCISEQVTSGQLRQLVIENLRDHPEFRHLPGATLVHEALLQEFACVVEVE